MDGCSRFFLGSVTDARTREPVSKQAPVWSLDWPGAKRRVSEFRLGTRRKQGDKSDRLALEVL